MIRPKLSIATPAVELPVTVPEALDHCRIKHSLHDSLIHGLISTATEHVEKITNRALCEQTWRAWWYCFPSDRHLVLPRGPVRSVTHLKYTDGDGAETAWSSSNYQADLMTIPARIWLKKGIVWPTTILREGLAVEVQFVCGYDTVAAESFVNGPVPPSFRQAILLLVDHWYRNTSAVTVGNNAAVVSGPLAIAVDALLTPFKIPAH